MKQPWTADRLLGRLLLHYRVPFARRPDNYQILSFEDGRIRISSLRSGLIETVPVDTLFVSSRTQLI